MNPGGLLGAQPMMQQTVQPLMSAPPQMMPLAKPLMQDVPPFMQASRGFTSSMGYDRGIIEGNTNKQRNPMMGMIGGGDQSQINNNFNTSEPSVRGNLSDYEILVILGSSYFKIDSYEYYKVIRFFFCVSVCVFLNNSKTA